MEKTRAELLEMYDFVGDFHEGVACARDKAGNCFHIKPDGSLVYKGKYDWVGSFVKGLAWAHWGEEEFQIRLDGTRVEE